MEDGDYNALPFMGIDNDNLHDLYPIEINTVCPCNDRAINNNLADGLPKFEILSKLDKIPNLSDSDAERYLSSKTNFNYYTPHNFHTSQEIIRSAVSKTSFSTIHCNIRSLQANYDKLCNLLADLNYNFSIIGLSETRMKRDVDQVSYNSIPGYEFVSLSSMTNAGGVGFFINENIKYIKRDDFTSATMEYESLWIEIDCGPHKNIICGILYRHPRSNRDNFTNVLFHIVDKVSRENKYCIFMGDFNIDLLNTDTCSHTEDYINTLSSFNFLPCILQPTRITEHSATLIDNIFSNNMEHHQVSGNVIHDITDHLPNFLILDKIPFISKKSKVYKRDYSNMNERDLLEEVQSIRWENELLEMLMKFLILSTPVFLLLLIDMLP